MWYTHRGMAAPKCVKHTHSIFYRRVGARPTTYGDVFGWDLASNAGFTEWISNLDDRADVKELQWRIEAREVADITFRGV